MLPEELFVDHLVLLPGVQDDIVALTIVLIEPHRIVAISILFLRHELSRGIGSLQDAIVDLVIIIVYRAIPIYYIYVCDISLY